MNTLRRVRRHVSIMRTRPAAVPPGPPFLILFISSICNMKCQHCFYWRSLNKRTDLTTEEIFELSRSLGKVENLNLSGGEPFLRRELDEICRQFIRHNGVRQIYIPTNGWYTDKTLDKVRHVLEEPDLQLLAVELSLDGTEEFHDRFRGVKGAFRRAMQTYDALAELQRSDRRLLIHSVATATATNIDEIRKLAVYLFERCPAMEQLNLAMIRGDRKNPDLDNPRLQEYRALYDYIRGVWAPRQQGRYGGSVDPMLQWAKLKTVREERQVVPCTAGRLSAVVYANGDVGICEAREPLGNLREGTFQEIWTSPEAEAVRRSVAAGKCWCTTEVFLWPSIVYQPLQLARAMVGGRVWSRPPALDDHARTSL